MLGYWWRQRGLWIVGDIVMIVVGAALFIYSLVHLFG
jgi:hypothetical protein